MKICFITEYFPTRSLCDIRGGAEAVAFHEAKCLAKNHDISVITSFERGTKREDEFENMKVYRCGRARDYVQSNAFTDRFSFMQSAYRFGKRRHYDLVIGFSIITYPVAWKISKRLNVPCIIRYHDVLIGRWVKNFGLTGLIGELVERYTLSRKFAAIIAVSEYTAGNLEKHYRDKGKIFVVHNGVEVPEATVAKDRNPTVVCVSRLVRYKHIDDLVHAVGLLVKDFPDIQCKIIGSGPEEEKLKNLAVTMGISGHVTFTGFVNDHADVLKTIRSAHVFCLPSSLEGFGIVVLEAMACGVPFVASDIPPIAEASGGKGGLFFTCLNIGDLAAKIRLVLEDPQLQSRLIDEGLKRAEEFRWENISKKAEAIYIKAVAEWKTSASAF